MVTFFPSRAVAISLFGFDIHWYGIFYIVAFLLVWLLLPLLKKHRGFALTADDRSGILTAGILGVLLGGRLGYVLFYHPAYYASHPLEILTVWRGGMSSHGGFVGAGIALAIIARRRQLALPPLLDLIAVPAAMGLALGRIGNFVNQELYGTVTTLPWGMAFPGAEGLRHPVQLYAVVANLCIAGCCFWHLRRSRMEPPGGTIALFLILYGVLRFLLEFVREPDSPLVSLGFTSLTRGQLYSVPLLALGIVLWLLRGREMRAQSGTKIAR